MAELHDRNRADAPHPISAEDMAEFLRQPELWRQNKPRVERCANGVVGWMQFVFEDMGLNCFVPPIKPDLTERQRESLRRFGFRLFFIPAIIEADYPSSFVKPDWGRDLNASPLSRRPLPGKWVAVETIQKPNLDDPEDYHGDQLASAIGLQVRFGISWDYLHQGGLLAKIAKVTGFPQKGVRLPIVEEWNFLGNLMNWLRENRGEDHLPDLGSTDSWEWCENSWECEDRLVVGSRERGGLAHVGRHFRGDQRDYIGFRVLAVL
jgi:hypothetical protein